MREPQSTRGCSVHQWERKSLETLSHKGRPSYRNSEADLPKDARQALRVPTFTETKSATERDISYSSLRGNARSYPYCLFASIILTAPNTRHNLSRFIHVKGLFGSWLTPDRYQEGGALGYKVVGTAHIHDSITINTINFTLMFMCSACSFWHNPTLPKLKDRKGLCKPQTQG
jgi:hypothetical protein